MVQRKKQIPIEWQFGRMMRNMASMQMQPFGTETWLAATDIYETERDIVVCMDFSGVDPETLSVTAGEMNVKVCGERKFPIFDKISCIHQLEIDRGFLERTVSLPKPVDVSATTSVYKNGLLIISLPKQKNKGKVQIEVR